MAAAAAAATTGLRTTGRVAVVGAGISGLSSAACLQRIGYDVHLFEGKDEDTYLQDKPDHGFGIWSNALQYLVKLGLKEQLESKGRFMKEVGYKTKSGEWLAQPSKHLQQHLEFAAGTPVSLFMLYSDLIKMMRSVAPPIKFSTKFEQIASSCSSPEYDFHVIATGNDLRRADIAYRGYVVYRGLCPASRGGRGGGGSLQKGCSLEGGDGLNASFQTWSNGKRFATVPMRDHWVWYATVPTIPLKQEQEGMIAAVSDNNPLSSPSCRVITEQQKRNLIDEFSEWHDPILPLIENTGREHITAEFAYSSTGTTMPPPSSSSSQSVFLGDAAVVQDPILAQGGGVCIEEAFQLAYQISYANKNSLPISVAFAAFEQKRKKRIRTLQYLSNLSQTIGCLKSPLDTVRDVSMLAVPGAVSCFMFDTLMAASVSTSLLVNDSDFDFLTTSDRK